MSRGLVVVVVKEEGREGEYLDLNGGHSELRSWQNESSHFCPRADQHSHSERTAWLTIRHTISMVICFVD